MIDSRFVLKITGFGLTFLHGDDPLHSIKKDQGNRKFNQSWSTIPAGRRDRDRMVVGISAYHTSVVSSNPAHARCT